MNPPPQPQQREQRGELEEDGSGFGGGDAVGCGTNSVMPTPHSPSDSTPTCFPRRKPTSRSRTSAAPDGRIRPSIRPKTTPHPLGCSAWLGGALL